MICFIISDLGFSLHVGSFRESRSSFTPDGPGSFPVRSSSIRCEGFDLRAEARALYPSSVILQSESLEEDKNNQMY